MQLAPMRFTKIDGTAVAVDVRSADEAKEALKELRHKKRELKFIRASMARQVRAARPRRSKAKPEKGGFETFLADVRWGFSAMLDTKGREEPAQRKATLPEMELEVNRLDAILHNIEGCILQLQGKLLSKREA